MERQENSCCVIEKNTKNTGILSGILLGILPHSFCIAFAIFSMLGAITASAFLKKFMLIPNFFFFLVIISLAISTISSIIYLKRNKCLCVLGIKNKWGYITALYSGTILVNLLMFFIILPMLANINPQKEPEKYTAVQNQKNSLSDLTLSVQIPCSGHAALIIDEIKKNCDIQSIVFSLPNTFSIKYDPQKISPEKIASLEIFKTYEATIN